MLGDMVVGMEERSVQPDIPVKMLWAFVVVDRFCVL